VNIPDDFLKETGIKMVSKMDLLEASDFVSVNCDLNPTSYHLVSTREFAAMKNTAFLINIARGPVIDEKCLIDALNEGLIAGAGLDVFEAEPLPDNSPLLTMDNVMLAPHNANSSPVAWENVTIGWIGGPGNIVFLDIVEAALSKLQSEFPELRILVISRGKWKTEQCVVEHRLW